MHAGGCNDTGAYPPGEERRWNETTNRGLQALLHVFHCPVASNCEKGTQIFLTCRTCSQYRYYTSQELLFSTFSNTGKSITNVSCNLEIIFQTVMTFSYFLKNPTFKSSTKLQTICLRSYSLNAIISFFFFCFECWIF